MAPHRPDLVYKRTGDLSIASLLAVWSVNQHTHKLIRHERFGEFFYFFLYNIIYYCIHPLHLKFSCFDFFITKIVTFNYKTSENITKKGSFSHLILDELTEYNDLKLTFL